MTGAEDRADLAMLLERNLLNLLDRAAPRDRIMIERTANLAGGLAQLDGSVGAYGLGTE